MFGDHAIVCGGHGELIARHNHLRNAIFEAAKSGHLAPRMEENALIPGNRGKPAEGVGGKDTALDVTVVHPLTPPRIASSAESPGSTLDLETAYRGKWSQTEEACAQEGTVFAPSL